MNDIAIKVENLSKVYKLYDHSRDRLKEALHPLRKIYHSNFNALDKVSFEIRKGETVGIIGKNGAGKSTLLKIITGVLTQTNGNIHVNGRISSLLELGAGFNPEYTGIENIYLQGTLMGLSHNEMSFKVEKILLFADIGDFIPQPVRMYSSGMFARLAFSIAINVDPDILIVDEALSVGDFAFQYKCFMKFKQLKEAGKTILFVTHGMQEIIKYCDRAIYIKNGSIRMDNQEVENVVFAYETETRSNDTMEYKEDKKQQKEGKEEHRFGNKVARIEDIKWIQDNTDMLISGKSTIISLEIHSTKTFKNAVLGYSLKNDQGVVVWGDSVLSMNRRNDYITVNKGINKVSIDFHAHLVPGEYYFYIGLSQFNEGVKTDIDQRWRVNKIKFYSERLMGEGYVYAPSKLEIRNKND